MFELSAPSIGFQHKWPVTKKGLQLYILILCDYVMFYYIIILFYFFGGRGVPVTVFHVKFVCKIDKFKKN